MKKSPGETRGFVALALGGGVSLPPAPFPAAPSLPWQVGLRCIRSDYAPAGAVAWATEKASHPQTAITIG